MLIICCFRFIMVMAPPYRQRLAVSPPWEGVVLMITWSEWFEFSLVVIGFYAGFIGLFAGLWDSERPKYQNRLI